MALGRAIIAETPVCLMDEPLSNLDAQLRAEMRREIRELQQKLGITMIYVTHDQSEAMSMADQVILMRDGRVEQAAAPHRLYAHPTTTFAARFIGTPPMNILILEPSTDGTFVAGSGARVFSVQVQELSLGIRPEDVILRERRSSGARFERRVSGGRHRGHLRAWPSIGNSARLRKDAPRPRRFYQCHLAHGEHAFLRHRKRKAPR